MIIYTRVRILRARMRAGGNKPRRIADRKNRVPVIGVRASHRGVPRAIGRDSIIEIGISHGVFHIVRTHARMRL
jgi:hypothetical protein